MISCGEVCKTKVLHDGKIIVDVAWCDRNYGGSFGSNVPGAVVFTAPTFEALQKKQRKVWSFILKALWKWRRCSRMAEEWRL